MATITANTGSGVWATGATWVGGVAPTAADDAVIPSGATVNIAAAGAVCRSLTVASGATLTHNNNIGLTIGDATAGAGNVALSISSGATVSFIGVSGAYSFISTSATQQTIDTGGKTLPNITINGAGSSYIALAAVTTSVAFTLTTGTYNTGSFAHQSSTFASNGSTTRTLTLGSTTWTITGTANVLWNTSTTTNMTFNAGTSALLLSSAAQSNAVFAFGNLSMYNVTRTGTAAKTNYFLLSGNLTCTGTFTVNGDSAINRILVASGNRATLAANRGTPATITAATVTITNSDFMDITGAGAGDWDLSAITGNSGDCGGNSGITFTTPATQTATGTASFSWSTHGWTSRVPLPQDDVVIANSFIAGRTITADMPRLGRNITMSSATGSPIAAFNTTTELYGSLAMATGMTAPNTQQINFAGRSSHTITSNGVTFGNQMHINGPGGTYTLSDAFTSTSSNGLAITMGSFVSAGYTITSGSVASSGSLTRSVDITNSTINLTATAGTPWNFATVTNLTFTSTGSTIVISTAGTSTRSFSGGGLTYNDLTYTVADSPAQLNILGSNTFNTLNIGPGRILAPASSTTTTLTTLTALGAANGYLYVGYTNANVTVPDSTAISTTGDFDMRIRLAFATYTASNVRIASKSGSSPNLSWTWRISNGQMSLELSTNGTSIATTATASANITSPGAGNATWLRLTRESSSGNVKFYQAADNASMPSSWTQIGTTATGSTGALYDSASSLFMDGLGGGGQWGGKLYRYQLRDNILDDGTGIQLDADFSTKPIMANTFTESSSNAATVSIATNLTRAGDGRIILNSATAGTVANLSKPSGGLLTTNSDYLQVQDLRMYQPQSFFAGANSVLVSNTFGVYASAPTTYRHVQSIAAAPASSTSITATYPSATTSGGLLVAYFTSSGSQGASFTPPAGWSLAISQNQTVWVYIYYKIADGTETTVTFTQSTSRNLNMSIVEYTGFTGTPTLDVTDSNTAGAVTSLSTTATTGPTNTAQPALAVAMLANASTLAATTGLTNSFMEDSTLTASSSAYKGAVKELTNLAAVETTFSWTTARSNYAVGLAVFKDSAAAANGSFFPFF